MDIRLATPDDFPKLWELCVKFMEGQVALGAPDQRRSLAFAIHYGVQNYEAVFVAELGDELVGFVCWVGVPMAADGEVLGLGTYVDPMYREAGLSNELREAAKKHCRTKGYRFVSGAVLTDNVPGNQAAASSGGEVIGYMLRWDL